MGAVRRSDENTGAGFKIEPPGPTSPPMRNLRPAPICAFPFSIATGIVAAPGVAHRRLGQARDAGPCSCCSRSSRTASRSATRSGDLRRRLDAGVRPRRRPVGSGAGRRPGRPPWRSSSWARAWDVRIGDVATLAGFALVTGLAARLGHVQDPVHDWLAFTALVSGVYMLAAIVNFALVAVYMRMLRGRSFSMNIALHSAASATSTSQLVHALGTAALAYAYVRVGAAAIVFAGVSP